ncbi:YhgE/Pip domain-containing protein [Jeotgalibacillus marinus]|uniref:ABC transporter permease n=1 Tax=Jeotgalibacillus marinus TaxID=86667 RepID=A0ABV3Q666_9BACL
MNFGEKMKEAFTADTLPTGEDSPFLWTEVQSEQQARDAMNNQEYYATLVVPSTFSSNVMSLLNTDSAQSSVTVILNQGKNLTVATTVNTIMDKMIAGLNGQLREQLINSAEERGMEALPTAQVNLLAEPVNTVFETVNAVGERSANGNAPVVFTQLLWVGSMVGALTIFLTARNVKEGQKSGWGTAIGQLVLGAIIALIASGSLLFTGVEILSLRVPDMMEMWGYTALISYCFFLLMTGILNWTGLKGMPLLALLFFFGPPALSLPVEFLPDVSRYWLLSWVPLRFGVEILRDLFYFGEGLNLREPLKVLSLTAAVGAALVLLSELKPVKEPQGKKDKATT